MAKFDSKQSYKDVQAGKKPLSAHLRDAERRDRDQHGAAEWDRRKKASGR